MPVIRTPLDKTYQFNEKLTWLKGSHSLKIGGQLMHYVQQRFYAGNNGLLGIFRYTAAFTNFAFSDFLLDQVLQQGSWEPRGTLDALAQSFGAVHSGRLQDDACPSRSIWECAGRSRSRL